MRGSDARSGELFSYVDLEKRVPEKHPLRLVRVVVNDVLAALDGDFTKVYADSGRPSIAPERLLRALLLQAFYTIRSERQLMEQLDYNLPYRWFVGLGVVIRCGCRRCSRRTGIDCLRPMWRGGSWPNS
jgi:transposase